MASGSRLNVTGVRLMITIIASALVIVAVVAILSGAGWWFLPIAVLALLALLGCLVRLVFQMIAIREHASPTATAAMQADGITNPDEFFSAIVDEFTSRLEGKLSEHRTVSVQEDPSRAAAEQRAAGTPTSGPSKLLVRVSRPVEKWTTHAG